MATPRMLRERKHTRGIDAIVGRRAASRHSGGSKPHAPRVALSTGVDRAQHSETSTRPEAYATQSEQLWGVDFLAALAHPPQLPAEVEVMRGDWERVVPFLKRFPTLSEAELVSADPRVSLAKDRYLRRFCDLIEYRQHGETIGVFVGSPEDWSTYYCRVLAFDPRYVARPMLRRLARECLEKPLAALGVERLVGETGPVNTAMARWFLDLGFHITGQRLTERWGAITHFTKFLNKECSQMFAHRFKQGRGDWRAKAHPTGGREL